MPPCGITETLSDVKSVMVVHIQKYCVDKLNVKTEAWKVELVWLSTKEGELELAYWGVYMNIELTAVCKYQDGAWNVTEVYYC